MAGLFLPARIGPAATGRAAPRAPPWSATSTARACATTRRRARGIRRTRHAGPMAAAARRTCAAPAAAGCSTASPPIRWSLIREKPQAPGSDEVVTDRPRQSARHRRLQGLDRRLEQDPDAIDARFERAGLL